MTDHKLFVNEDRTVLVRVYANGRVEVATRPHPDHIWGAPVNVTEEKPDG